MFWQNPVKKDEEIQKILEEPYKEGTEDSGREKRLASSVIHSRNRDWELAMYMPKDRFRNEERNIFLFFVLLVYCLPDSFLPRYAGDYEASQPSDCGFK